MVSPGACSAPLFPKLLLSLLHLLDCIFFSISTALFYVGLSAPSTDEAPQTPSSSWEEEEHDLTSSVASAREMLALPVVEFASRVDGRHEEEKVVCSVCLSALKGRDEVRELGNCCHAFHKECIDRWVVSAGRLTCPVCRSHLLPLRPRVDTSASS